MKMVGGEFDFFNTKKLRNHQKKQQQENPMDTLDQKVATADNAESRGDGGTFLTSNQEIFNKANDRQNKKGGSQLFFHNKNSTNDDAGGTRALEHIADAYATTKSWALARQIYSQALLSSNKVEVENDRETSSHAHASIPSTIFASSIVGNNEASTSYSIRSSAGDTLNTSSPATFNILQKLSKACMNLKDYDCALKAQVKSLDVIDRSHNTSSNLKIATILNNMGHIHFKKGDMQNAIMFYQQYLDAQKSFPEDRRDLLVEAGTASTIGSIYRRIGRLNAAIDWHETAIKLRTEVLGEHHMSLSSDLIAIGHIHYCLRQLDFSLAAFSECVELFSLSICAPDTGLLASILFKMAGICIELDDRSAAINCYEDAVDAARAAVGSSSTSSTSKSTVTPSLASSCFKRTCCEVLIIRCLYNLARLHQEEGNISKAIDCAEEAVKFGLLDASTVLPRNESLTRILSFMIRLYHEKGDDAKIQLYCRRLSEVVDDCSRQPKRTKLFCARAA